MLRDRKRIKVALFAPAAVLLCLCALATPAAALEQARPRWTVTSVSEPTNFAPSDPSHEQYYYRVVVTNTGGHHGGGTRGKREAGGHQTGEAVVHKILLLLERGRPEILHGERSVRRGGPQRWPSDAHRISSSLRA